MSITLKPSRERPELHVSGYIDAVLAIPAQAPRPFPGGELVDTYYIALSDGTLIRARYAEHPAFEVVVDGAGLIEIDEEAGSVTICWRVEWVNVSVAGAGSAIAQRSVRTLPLFAAGSRLAAAV